MHTTKRKPSHQSRSQPVSAYRDAWYEAPFYDNALREDFFDCRIKLAAICPETALMYAVLEDAFLRIHKPFEADRRRTRGAREAREWFFNDNSSWLFAFLPICDALGLEPHYIRTKLKHWMPCPLDTNAGNALRRFDPCE